VWFRSWPWNNGPTDVAGRPTDSSSCAGRCGVLTGRDVVDHFGPRSWFRGASRPVLGGLGLGVVRSAATCSETITLPTMTSRLTATSANIGRTKSNDDSSTAAPAAAAAAEWSPSTHTRRVAIIILFKTVYNVVTIIDTKLCRAAESCGPLTTLR